MSNKLADILVAEDENIIALDIKLTLKRLGYKVVSVVNNGEDVLKEIHKTKPDLVLMDIQLNGKKSGIETAEEIFTVYGIPVVYLTGMSDSEASDRANKAMPFSYVHKPFDEKTLQMVIESALSKNPIGRQLKKKSFNPVEITISNNLLHEIIPQRAILN